MDETTCQKPTVDHTISLVAEQGDMMGLKIVFSKDGESDTPCYLGEYDASESPNS